MVQFDIFKAVAALDEDEKSLKHNITLKNFHPLVADRFKVQLIYLYDPEICVYIL